MSRLSLPMLGLLALIGLGLAGARAAGDPPGTDTAPFWRLYDQWTATQDQPSVFERARAEFPRAETSRRIYRFGPQGNAAGTPDRAPNAGG